MVRFGGRGEGWVGQVDDGDVGVLHVASVGECLVTLVSCVFCGDTVDGAAYLY